MGRIDPRGGAPTGALAALVHSDAVPESIDLLVERLESPPLAPLGPYGWLDAAIYGTLIVPVSFDGVLDVVACSIVSASELRSAVRSLVSALPIANRIGVDRFIDDLGFASTLVPSPPDRALHNLALLDRASSIAISSGRVALVDV